MHYKVYENVFDEETISKLLDFYNEQTRRIHVTNGMYKLEDPWNILVIQKLIKSTLSKYFNTDLENVGDNVYKHGFPYFPHVDSDQYYPCFNVLIPLQVHNNKEQKFCIFDQYVNDFSQGATWVGHRYDEIPEFESNKKRKYIFDDPIVENKTNDSADAYLFKECFETEYRNADLFKGLSGVAVDFKPGNLILFDSKYIHCTGKMSCDYKIGLSLRFGGIFEDEVK
jgi:hypothetical protein